MDYPIVEIGALKCVFKTPIVADILEISKINKKHYQKQLAYFLGQITGDPNAVALMTAQERYAAFLSYLFVSNNGLKDLDLRTFLADDLTQFSRERVDGGEGVTVRHLRGIEAEALELGCDNADDWLMGEIAITIGCEELPPLDLGKDVHFVAQMIESRIKDISALDVDVFNDLVEKYYRAQALLPNLVNLYIDSNELGYALGRFNGGADDAPIRFCVADAVSGFVQRFL